MRTLGSVCAAAPRELALRCSSNGCFHSRGAGVHLRMQTCRLRRWRHNAEVVQVMEQRAIGQKPFQFSFGIYLPEGCWCCFIFRLDLSKTSIKFIPTRAWTILYGERSICQENGSRNSQQFLSDLPQLVRAACRSKHGGAQPSKPLMLQFALLMKACCFLCTHLEWWMRNNQL